MRYISLNRSILLVSVFAFLSACASMDSQDGESEDTVRRVHDAPTGSHIRSNEDPENGAVPVQVGEREDLRRRGARTVGGALGGVIN